MNRPVKVNCPYCSHPNIFEVTNLFSEYKVINCDMETGGCDRLFFVNTLVSVAVDVRKIEGEGEDEDFV